MSRETLRTEHSTRSEITSGQHAETEASAAEAGFEKKKPERTCAGCGLKTEKEKLMRFALSPDGNVISDEIGRAGGRGLYLCRDEKCFARGLKKRAFSKGLKKERAESGLADLFENLRPGPGDK